MEIGIRFLKNLSAIVSRKKLPKFSFLFGVQRNTNGFILENNRLAWPDLKFLILRVCAYVFGLFWQLFLTFRSNVFFLSSTINELCRTSNSTYDDAILGNAGVLFPKIWPFVCRYTQQNMKTSGIFSRLTMVHRNFLKTDSDFHLRVLYVI